VSAIRISALSTEPVRYAVSAVIGGASYDPTTDAVQYAFIPFGRSPTGPDWLTGTWTTVTGPPVQYVAECLIGPVNGGIVLAPGMYVIWLKVTDSPSVPVRDVGTLQIF